MYGTIAFLRARQGHIDGLIAHGDSWWKDRVGKVDGALSAEMRQSDTDPQQFYLIVTFKTKEQYLANANDPEQDSWYQGLLEHLTEEPRWFDGETVAAYDAL